MKKTSKSRPVLHNFTDLIVWNMNCAEKLQETNEKEAEMHRFASRLFLMSARHFYSEREINDGLAEQIQVRIGEE